MTAPVPTAKGTLKSRPLSHLLIYLLDNGLTGTLVLEGPGGKRSAIFVEQGCPAKARTADAVIYLGRLLLERGDVDEAVVNETLHEVAKDQRLHGRALLARGAIDQETLLSGLREQVARKVRWMFELPAETLYGWYADQNLLATYGGGETTPIDPVPVIWQGVRSQSTADQVGATVGRLADRPLRFHREAQLGRYSFDAPEKALVDVMRMKAMSVEKLAGTGLADRTVVERLVHGLALTRALDLGTAAVPVGVSSAPPPAAASPAPPPAASTSAEAPPAVAASGGGAPESDAPPDSSMSDREKEIRALAAKIGQMNYYEMLDVTKDASSADIQGAFFALAKTWHPDRLPKELGHVRDLVTKVFSQLTAARATLDDAEQRKEYDELIAQGGGTPDEQDEVRKVLDAVTEFQKAEVFIKKHKWTEAEVHAKRAFEADSEQPEYRAIYAWIRANSPARAKSGKYADLIAELDAAVKQSENNVRVRFWRAQVLKRAGDTRKALADFRFVVSRDPNNLDATREIRLATMRGERTSEPPPGDRGSRPGDKPTDHKSGGLFGKLFKR